MTMQPFKIQSPTLSLNGINIDTSAQGKLVIPGVTRAGTSVAIEVNDTGDQTTSYPQLNGDPSLLTIIDGYQFAVLNGDVQAQVGWTAATYIADALDGEGFIDGITVATGGAGYTGEAVTYSQQMLATTYSDPINNFNPGNWDWIPFAVRCGAGEITSEFGGGSGSGLVQRTVAYPLGEEGDTAGTIALAPWGTTYICTADYVAPQSDDFTVLNTTTNLGQPTPIQGYQEFTIDLTQYSDVLDFLANPPYQFDSLPEISVDGGDTWIKCNSYAGGAPWTNDPPWVWYAFAGTALTDGQEVVVRYSSPVSRIWKQADTGDLRTNGQTLSSGQDLIGGEGTAYFGNNNIDLYAQSNQDRSWAEVWIRNNDTSAPHVDIITRPASPDWNNSNMKTWSFKHDGSMVFPDASVQTTAYTGAGGGGTTIGYLLTLGDLNTYFTNLRVVQTDGLGTAYYCGETAGLTPGNSPTIVKVDSTGTVQWQTTLEVEGTVTSAYFIGSSLYLTYTDNNGTVDELNEFGINTVDGSISSQPNRYDQGTDNLIIRDQVLGNINGAPGYQVMAGYMLPNGGTKSAFINGNGMGGPFSFTVTDNEGSSVEYFGIDTSTDGTAIYAVGYSSFYGSLVSNLGIGNGTNWHMNIDLGHGPDIQATSVAYDNGFIYVASNNTNNGNDGYLTKMDAVTGSVVWQRGMGNGAGGQNEYFSIYDGVVVVDGNGDIIVAWNYGAISSQGSDLLIVKFNPAGNCLWQRSLETAGTDYTNISQSTENLTADSEYFYLALTANASMPGVGGAVKLPLDGSGVNAYGIWTYRPQSWHVADSLGSNTSTDVTTSFTITPYSVSTSAQSTNITQTTAPTSLQVVYSAGNRSSLVNGSNSVTLDAQGNLNIPNNSNSATKGRIQGLNGYPSLMGYGAGGHGGPELDWMNSNNPTTDFSSNTTTRHTMYLNGSGLYVGINENSAPGLFSGGWQFATDGTLMLPDQSLVGSFVNDFSNNHNNWFVASVTGPNNIVYAIGGESNISENIVMAQSNNATLWRQGFSSYDFDDGAGSNYPQVMNIKFHNDGVYVGFDSGNSTGVVKLNATTGAQELCWVVQGSNTSNVSQKSFTVNTTGEPIIVGHSYGGYINYNAIAGTIVPTDGIYTNYLDVALGDIGFPHNMYRWYASQYQIDVDGTGSWYEPGDFNKYYNMPVVYSGTPGVGGLQISTDSIDYIAPAVTGQTLSGLDIDGSLWTDSGKLNRVLQQTNGVQFTIVIGSLTAGVDQTVLTFSGTSDWINTSGTLYHMDGNWTVVSGTGNMDTPATQILSITWGSVMTVDLEMQIDYQGGLYQNGIYVRNWGTNYQDGDTLVVKGSLLGGRDGAYILSANPVTGNGTTWYISQADWPSLDSQIPAGTLIRFQSVNHLGQTVVSVTDNGDGNWAVTVTGGQLEGGTMDFFAGNDAIITWHSGGYFDVFAWLPSENIRLSMSQTITPQSTYNIRRVEGQQAFVWTPNWAHTYGLTDQNEYFSDVAYDPVNNTVFASGYFEQQNMNPNQLVMALNANNGNTLWQKFVGDNNVGNWGYEGSIGVDPQGNVITVGNNDNGYAMITKQNGINGSVMWQTVQTNQNNWNNQALGAVDANGDVYFGNTYYNNNVGHYILSMVKLNGNDGTVAWARNVDNQENRYMYDMYDTFQQTINVGNGQVQWAGYVWDAYNDYQNAIAISLPADGSGIDTYGRWIVTEDTDVGVISGNDSYVVDPITVYTPTDALTFTSITPTLNFWSVQDSTITRQDIKLGGGVILFNDGSEINQAGIGRALHDRGNTNIPLDFQHNGKFLYFYGTNGNSTVTVPQNSDKALPIGYTVTLVLDDFDGNRVYINTGNDTNNGLHIAAVGYTQNYSNNNFWRIGDTGDTGIYTIMKVDTNRWILSGPNIVDDY